MHLSFPPTSAVVFFFFFFLSPVSSGTSPLKEFKEILAVFSGAIPNFYAANKKRRQSGKGAREKMRREPMSQLHAGHVGKKTCVRVVWMGRLEREVEIISIYNGWMDRYFICLSIAQNLIVKKKQSRKYYMSQRLFTTLELWRSKLIWTNKPQKLPFLLWK